MSAEFVMDEAGLCAPGARQESRSPLTAYRSPWRRSRSPLTMIEPELARRIKLLVLDADGVLTDNALFIGSVQGQRVEFKRFDVQDGLGLTLLRYAAIPVAIVSGRTSEATALRAAELKIADVYQDSSANKLKPMSELLERRGVSWEETAFVGDDLADVPVLKRVGLPIVVANAAAEARAVAAWVTTKPGGHGAVREVIETVLRARGVWDDVVRQYYRDRGDDAA